MTPELDQRATQAIAKLLAKMLVKGDMPDEMKPELELEGAEGGEEEGEGTELKPELELELSGSEPSDDMDYIKEDLKKRFGGPKSNLPSGIKKAATAGQASVEIGPIKKLKKALS